MKLILVSLLLCGFMLAAASPVFAQAAQQAELRVTVIDQTGASIPMARVLVTPPGATPAAVGVNDRGQVTLTALPIGNVQLHVESEGFTPVDRTVTLRRGSTNQTITLSIAGLQEEIVVSDAAADDQASIGVERALSQTVNLQASFMLMRGRNQLRSRNVNAPDVFGVRPEPNVGTVSQIESTGRSATNRFNVNLRYRVPGRRTFMNIGYTWSSAQSHAPPEA